MNKKGFTLFELLACLTVIIVVFFIAIPIVLNIIKNSKLDSFKTSALNTLDSIEYDLANTDFKIIDSNGIEIENIDNTVLKNNNFDEGLIIKNDNLLEFLYLKQDNYCAIGNKNNLVVSDEGCGALDKTNPTKAYVFLKTSTDNTYILTAAGYDPDSDIISYELSVDGGKYFSNKDESYNVFKVELNDSATHIFKVRVKNEAGLILESEEKTFKKVNNEICEIIDNKITCSTGQLLYSNDLNNWGNSNSIDMNSNQDIYLKNNDMYHLISIKNVDRSLNDASPILDDNMIPVIYENNKWVVANRNSIYYDYENNIWANAVVVKKKKDNSDPNSKDRSYYLSDEAIGEEINLNDVLSFYVWIPRYNYKLWNVNGNNKDIISIDILFNKNDNQMGLVNGIETNSMWYTHPAFLYDNEIQGFWVNKYPVSADKNSSCYSFGNLENCDNSNYNIYSNNDKKLVNVSLKNAYLLSKNITLEKNIYGFSNSESHLMTNLEWGSILYLGHSKYGINGKIESSTTGNETGVYYDSSINEMVMANYNGKYQIYNIEENIFIDNYIGSTSKSRILGDATLETEKWYESANNFISGSNPFILRGKNNPFSYDSYDGNASINNSFRTILYVK